MARVVAHIPTRRWLTCAAGLLLLVGHCGCLGPTGLKETRSEYNDAIHTTNDEELLLNLVRLRYSDGPMFLRLTGVNTQFEFDLGAVGRGGVDRGGASHYGEGTLGFADRPTLTFDPRRTPEFTRALLTRIDLDTFLLLDAAGWDFDRSLRLFVENLNGVPNATGADGPIPAEPPEYADFQHLAALLRKLHDERAITLAEETVQTTPVAVGRQPLSATDIVALRKAGFEVHSLGDNKGYALVEPKRVHGMRVDPRFLSHPVWAVVAQQLRLQPHLGFYEIDVQASSQLKPSGEPTARLTMTTRSLLEALFLLSHNVAVPVEHIRDGVVTVTHNPDGTPFDWGAVLGDLFRVCVSKHKPKNAAVAVPYRGYWYYLDDADVASKTTLLLLQEIIHLQKVGASEGQPLLTLPVGR
jgi:hypothetical protein